MPPSPHDPWHFDFPPGDGAHAVVTAALRPEMGKLLVVRFRVHGAGNLQAFNHGMAIGDPYVTLFLQRNGDNLSAQGHYASYRFYSRNSIHLTDGEHTLMVRVSPDAWYNVWGQRDDGGFASCLADLRVFGMVFGNPSAGATAHGVGGAGARFTLLSIEQRD